jgi:hydrogenase nickel incorporation protein HypA/HybF
MHEMSIVEALVDTVLKRAEEAKATKVLRVYLVVGELSGVLDEAVEFYFGFLTKDTIAAGATVFFTRPPTLVKCRNCGTEYSPVNLKLSCPNCKERKVEIISGRELYIDNMEVE